MILISQYTNVVTQGCSQKIQWEKEYVDLSLPQPSNVQEERAYKMCAYYIAHIHENL